MQKQKTSRTFYMPLRWQAFTFFEVIVAVVLAGILSLLAVSVFNWAFSDASERLVKLDANTFERNVRSLANIELRAVNNSDAATVIEEMTKDRDLSIVPSGAGFNITRATETYCVVLGDEVNEKGTINPGSCA
jgi:type II secretory pathway pseudopilin PulG